MKFSRIARMYPTYVEFETTSRCNINPPCPMCARAYRDTSLEHDMDEKTIHSCRHLLSNAETLSIFGIGEPLFDPRFTEFVKMKADKIVLLSNGQIMTDGHIDAILYKPVERIVFSLDAASPQTYCKIRGYDLHTFDKVISNIEKLIKTRNNRELSRPEVKLAMVIMRENFHEVPSFIELAYSLGTDGVQFWPLDYDSGGYRRTYRNGWLYDEIEQSNVPPDYMRDIIEYGKELHKKHGFSLDWRTREGLIV